MKYPRVEKVQITKGLSINFVPSPDSTEVIGAEGVAVQQDGGTLKLTKRQPTSPNNISMNVTSTGGTCTVIGSITSSGTIDLSGDDIIVDGKPLETAYPTITVKSPPHVTIEFIDAEEIPEISDEAIEWAKKL